MRDLQERNALRASRRRELEAEAPPGVRELVATAVREHADMVVNDLFSELAFDEDARLYLTRDVIENRLRAELVDWLKTQFNLSSTRDHVAVVAAQQALGQVHARILVPLDLMFRAMILIRRGLSRAVIESTSDEGDAAAAVMLVADVVDNARDTIVDAYHEVASASVRDDEVLRGAVGGVHLEIQSERLRAAVFDWHRQFVTELLVPSKRRLERLPSLDASEFGRWIRHRGRWAIGEGRELHQLARLVEQVDEIVTEADAARAPDVRAADAAALMSRIDPLIAELSWVLNTLAERAADEEGGAVKHQRAMDPRHVPSVLRHEVQLGLAEGRAFAVVLVEVDNLRQISGSYGYEAAETVLRAVAELLNSGIHASDFVFRYGAQQFLVVLTDADEPNAQQRADELLRRVRRLEVSVKGDRSAVVTASLGVALYDGHPDPDRVVRRADEALSAASAAGGDRVEIASQGC
jgi:diguanylate cyclase